MTGTLGNTSKQKMDPQTQSPFFRLPAEIRAQILELVVYDGAASQHVVHFEAGGGRGPGQGYFVRLPCRPVPDRDLAYRNAVEWFSLHSSSWRGGHLACRRAMQRWRPRGGGRDDDDDDAADAAVKRKEHRRETGAGATSDRLASPLPLLLACRRLHDEVADVLYASLVFVGLKPLRRFLRAAGGDPRDRSRGAPSSSSGGGYLARVRAVEVQWEAVMRSHPTTAARANNLDFGDWGPTCERLTAALPGLRHLRAKIIVCDRTSARVAELFTRPLLRAVERERENRKRKREVAGGEGAGEVEIEVVAEVIRNCWDPHSDPAKKRVAAVTLGGSEVPIRICSVDPRNIGWPRDHISDQPPDTG